MISEYGAKFNPISPRALHGKYAEDKFVNCVNKYGFFVNPSSVFDNIRNHFDFVINKPQTSPIKVEVKSLKSKDETNIWIEFRNVNGNDGWLYGRADVIAFERIDDFVLVNRKDLVKFCESNVILEKIEMKIGASFYDEDLKKYRAMYRGSRPQESTTLIKTEDILNNTKNFSLKK